MSVTPATFRGQFPEFSDPLVYTDSQINFWAGLAVTFINADRLSDIVDYAIALFVAHHMSIGARDQAAAAVGGQPGEIVGPKTAKSVDKVSASYDTASITLEGGGFWNSTAYGVRLLQLARMYGAGGIQI
jgi:Protein of unknown function (DUF4054)